MGRRGQQQQRRRHGLPEQRDLCLKELINSDNQEGSLSLVLVSSPKIEAWHEMDCSTLRNSVFNLIQNHKDFVGTVMLSGKFLQLFCSSDRVNYLIKELNMLRHVKKVVLMDFEQQQQPAGVRSRRCNNKGCPLSVLDLVQILEPKSEDEWAASPSKLEEIELLNVTIQGKNPGDMMRLFESLRTLKQLKRFQAKDCSICELSAQTNQVQLDELFRVVVALPALTSIHLHMESQNPALPAFTKSKKSESLKHISLQGPNWTNLVTISAALLGVTKKDLNGKRSFSGERKLASTPQQQQPPLCWQSLSVKGPNVTKPILSAFTLSSLPLEALTLEDYCEVFADDVDDDCLKLFLEGLRNNKTLKKLHIHNLSSVTPAGYKALLKILQSDYVEPAIRNSTSSKDEPEKNQVFEAENHVLESFNVNHIQDLDLLQDLKVLLAWNKFGLRSHAKDPLVANVKEFQDAFCSMMETYPQNSDENVCTDAIFRLLTANPELAKLFDKSPGSCVCR